MVMKKLLLLLIAAGTLFGASAQSPRFNADQFRKKIESSEADIVDPKKNISANTWITRGNNYYDAAMAPLQGIFRTMSADDLRQNSGDPKERVVREAKNREYEVWVYDNYDVFMDEGKIAFWEQKVSIDDNALQTAYESYQKALEIDPKTLNSVTPLIEKVITGYKQEADVTYVRADYKKAAEAFGKVYDYSKNPPVEVVDTIFAYNAGFISILDENYDNAIKYLEQVKDLGFYNNGDTYKLLYFAYQGKNDNENSEKVLREGIEKYPAYTELIEFLVVMYSATGKDVEEIMPIIEQGIAQEPNNYLFHFGLGTSFLKDDNYARAIDYFKKSAEIKPDDFGSFFNLAIAMVRSTDDLINELNEIPVEEQEKYEQMKDQINQVFLDALPYLQRAHELDPADITTVNLMRNIYDRFKDDSEDMMQNFQKYERLYNSMRP